MVLNLSLLREPTVASSSGESSLTGLTRSLLIFSPPPGEKRRRDHRTGYLNFEREQNSDTCGGVWRLLRQLVTPHASVSDTLLHQLLSPSHVVTLSKRARAEPPGVTIEAEPSEELFGF